MNNRLLLYSCSYFNIHFLQPLPPIRHSLRHRWHPAAVFASARPRMQPHIVEAFLFRAKARICFFSAPIKMAAASANAILLYSLLLYVIASLLRPLISHAHIPHHRLPKIPFRRIRLHPRRNRNQHRRRQIRNNHRLRPHPHSVPKPQQHADQIQTQHPIRQIPPALPINLDHLRHKRNRRTKPRRSPQHHTPPFIRHNAPHNAPHTWSGRFSAFPAEFSPPNPPHPPTFFRPRPHVFQPSTELFRHPLQRGLTIEIKQHPKPIAHHLAHGRPV